MALQVEVVQVDVVLQAEGVVEVVDLQVAEVVDAGKKNLDSKN